LRRTPRSLLEEIGGHRNWDYRYTWIREATLTLASLPVLGFTEEAEDFSQLDEAEQLLAWLLGLANDVGLFSEEVDPATGEQLGNFLQSFSHMPLVTSCAHLTAARQGLIPDGAHGYAELALDRLPRPALR